MNYKLVRNLKEFLLYHLNKKLDHKASYKKNKNKKFNN